MYTPEEEPVPQEERIQIAAHGTAQADMLRRQRPGEKRGRDTQMDSDRLPETPPGEMARSFF